MRRFLFTAVVLALIVTPAMAQPICEFELICSKTDGTSEGGWVVSIPSGPSDYFNVRYDAFQCDPYRNDITTPQVPEIICGMSIGMADFGAGFSYPRLGVAPANFGVDATGNSPFCAGWACEINNVPGDGQICGNAHCYDCPPVDIISLGGIAHVVAQFPSGDNGSLGICGDSDTRIDGGDECPAAGLNPIDSTFFTQDCYSSPGAGPLPADAFLNLIIDPNAYNPGNLGPGRGGVLTAHSNPTYGDYIMLTTQAGNAFGLGFFGQYSNAGPTLWALFVSFLGVPIIGPVGPVLPALPYDHDGDGRPDYTALKLTSTWPLGAGGLTLNFMAFSAAVGVSGSIQLSNEITVCSLPDPTNPWGSWDDGGYEGGWVVQIPSSNCDYFAVYFDPCPTAVTVNVESVAVMDFGTPFTAYPSSGHAPPNTFLDPTGLSPDFFNAYINMPFTFPSLTFVSTAGQLVQNSFATFSPSAGVSTFIQFPSGDNGQLGVGGDSISTFFANRSSWTLDCFSTPGNLWFGNFGLRAK